MQLVRDKIGPVAAFKLAITVTRLPKTRSGKILRGTIKKIADGEPWTMPATIDDPAVLDEIGGALKGKGVGAYAQSATFSDRHGERAAPDAAMSGFLLARGLYACVAN